MDLKLAGLRTWAATAEGLEAAILILIKSLTVEEDLISAAITTANLMQELEVMALGSSEAMAIKAHHQ